MTIHPFFHPLNKWLSTCITFYELRPLSIHVQVEAGGGTGGEDVGLTEGTEGQMRDINVNR